MKLYSLQIVNLHQKSFMRSTPGFLLITPPYFFFNENFVNFLPEPVSKRAEVDVINTFLSVTDAVPK